jgi:tellurite resistance protein TehA-like permease
VIHIDSHAFIAHHCNFSTIGIVIPEQYNIKQYHIISYNPVHVGEARVGVGVGVQVHVISYHQIMGMNGLKRIILNFTPSWFSVNMGTGIISILLYSAPHDFTGRHTVAAVFYVLNVVLFCIFFIISLLRYILYPWVFLRMLCHPVQSLYIGTFPMGLATIVNATVLMAVPKYGDWAIDLAFTLWWIDVVITILSAFGVTYVMFRIHDNAIHTAAAVWLLPIVPAVVASASGGLVATIVKTQEEAMIVLCASWILWGVGLGLSILVLALYLHRLLCHKLPNGEVIVSAFLPLGPLGQGSFGLIQMGIVAKSLFNQGSGSSVSFSLGVQNAGDIIYVISLWGGLIMWGFGTFCKS